MISSVLVRYTPVPATPAVCVAETCSCQGVSHTLISHQCQPMNIDLAEFGLAVIHCIKHVMVNSSIALFSASSTWLYSLCCLALLFCSTNDLSAHDANALLSYLTFCKTGYCLLTCNELILALHGECALCNSRFMHDLHFKLLKQCRLCVKQ